MIGENNPKLTKSDFLLFCEAPRHLWAKRNGRIDRQPSDFDRHIKNQGYVVESLARDYLETVFLPANPGADLFWQRTYSDSPFEARVDALIYWPDSDQYDLYEIKSATGTDKKDIYDVAFQSLVLKSQLDLRRCYVLHLNKEYIQFEDTDLAQLFIAEDVTEKVFSLLPDIAELRRGALQAAGAADPLGLPHCLAPKECPCPAVCHPDLPEFSIFDIPRLGQKKKVELLEMGIRDAAMIPADFDLNAIQRLVVERARTRREHIDRRALRDKLEGLQFPLWFLDYETCILAVPHYPGYRPQQQVVFQYSLHCLSEPDSSPQHAGHVALCEGDPSLELLEHLMADLGGSGNVVVWNKTFEMTMNKEMARLHPEYEEFLADLNARVFDLAEVVNAGIYLHPGFKGSWSIKNVLPVMVPELSYLDLPIHKGDQASMAWWAITFGNLEVAQRDILRVDLERYCALDTLAMVEIYRKLRVLPESGATS
ncbi:DUF2779 domain-containing protein [bacterium]|nr:MAG: DUF2779 domain-containing protein [bacterium]